MFFSLKFYKAINDRVWTKIIMIQFLYLPTCHFYWRILYVYMVFSYCQAFFISSWRNPFSISCRTSLMVINSLNFYLSGNILISASFLKTVLPDTEFSGFWFCFCFLSALSVYHCIAFWSAGFLLRTMLTISRIPYMWSIGFLLMLSIHFVFEFHSLMYCVSVWVSFEFTLLEFVLLVLYFHVFPQMWGFSNHHCFFK